MTTNTGYAGQRQDYSGNDWSNALDFAISMFMGGVATAKLVKVVASYPAVEQALGGVVGFVDVQPLVNMADSDGVAAPHGTIFKLPYFRLQGGANAVIMDPVAGDIGLATFMDRDTSAVVRTKAVSNPGSFRRFDMADGMYFGGFLNGSPTQFVEFLANGAGIKVTTPGNLVVSAANCTLDAAGNLSVKGNVTANAGASHVDLVNHTHGGVASGSAHTAPPDAGT